MNDPKITTVTQEALDKALDDLRTMIKHYNSARGLARQKYQAEIAAIEDKFTQMDLEGQALRNNGIPSTQGNRLMLAETMQKQVEKQGS